MLAKWALCSGTKSSCGGQLVDLQAEGCFQGEHQLRDRYLAADPKSRTTARIEWRLYPFDPFAPLGWGKSPPGLARHQVGFRQSVDPAFSGNGSLRVRRRPQLYLPHAASRTVNDAMAWSAKVATFAEVRALPCRLTRRQRLPGNQRLAFNIASLSASSARGGSPAIAFRSSCAALSLPAKAQAVRSSSRRQNCLRPRSCKWFRHGLARLTRTPTC